MQPTVEHRGEVRLAMRVRQNVVPAAIGAAFLLYFGFLHLAEPTGTDLFNRANWVFYHTLRLGGLAMGVIAAWSLFGHSITLAVDAVVTVAIGALLVLTGLGMAVDGGPIGQTIINVVCGGMFISSGLHNWKDCRFLSPRTASRAATFRAPGLPDLNRPAHTAPTVRPKPHSSSQGERRDEGREHREAATPPPPPEGFLAALAEKTPPPDAGDEGLHT
ncbi:MAG: hypothetical protein V1790_02900 [Planctomycetota bacterium]